MYFSKYCSCFWETNYKIYQSTSNCKFHSLQSISVIIWKIRWWTEIISCDQWYSSFMRAKDNKIRGWVIFKELSLHSECQCPCYLQDFTGYIHIHLLFSMVTTWILTRKQCTSILSYVFLTKLCVITFGDENNIVIYC